MIHRGPEYTPSPPQVDQLVELRNLVTNSAARHGTLRSYGKKPHGDQQHTAKAHYAQNEIDFMYDESLSSDEVMRVRRGLAVHVSAQSQPGQPRQHGLELYSRIAIEKSSDSWRRGVTKYEFKWNSQKVELARRAIKFIGISAPEADGHDLFHALDAFHMPDDMAAVWSAEVDFATVTADDLPHLQADIKEYLTTFDNLARTVKN